MSNRSGEGTLAWLARARCSVKRFINRELNQIAYNAQMLDLLGVPEVFQVELTNRCPMTCVMCPRTNGMTRTLGHMDTPLFHHVIRQLVPFTDKIFLHHFGDSLVHPELGAFIRHASSEGLATYLSTNPILLTERRVREIVDGGLHELVISLDGVTAEMSAAMRGEAARDVVEAERRILRLLEYRRSRRTKFPHVILQFVSTKINQHETDAWLRKWTAVEGVDMVKVKSFVSWDGRDERINALRVDAEPRTAGLVCDKPWTSVTVLWDGRVVPCCFDHDATNVLGDLRHQSLREICAGEPMRELRRAHRDRSLAGVKLCAHCVDKEGYPVKRWIYPLNRWFLRSEPLGKGEHIDMRGGPSTGFVPVNRLRRSGQR